MSTAESAFGEVDGQIKRLTAEIEERMKSLEKTAKGALPSDCAWWETNESCGSSPAQAR